MVQGRTGSMYAKCADGYIFLFNLVPYSNLFILMERFDLLEDESLQVPTNWWAALPRDPCRLRRVGRNPHEAGDLPRRPGAAHRRRPVNTMADVAANPQHAARDWFGKVKVGGKEFLAPGFPYRFTGTPCRVQGPAPKLGEHTAEVFTPAFAWANAGLQRGSEHATPPSAPSRASA